MEEIKLIELYKGFKKDQEFKLVNPKVDDETGAIESTVQYLPKFDEMKRKSREYSRRVKEYALSTDPDISNAAKLLIRHLNKTSDLAQNLEILLKRD